MISLHPSFLAFSAASLVVATAFAGCAVSDTKGRDEGSRAASAQASAHVDASAAPLSSELAQASASASGSTSPAPSLAGSGPSSATAALPSASAPVDAAGSASAVDGEKPPCPPGMVLLNRYCIDAYEDALEEETPTGFAPHPYYERPPSDKRYRAVSAAGQFPQGYISRVEAKAACEASGKRLCSKREWQYACRGKGFQTYPYGDRGVKDKCNTGKIHLLTQMFKHPQGGMKYEEHFNSPELNKTPGFLAKSGEYADCTTERGVHDMVGNLHEWVSDTVTQDLVDKLEDDHVERRNQPWHEGNGVFMSGFYSTTSEHGPGCYFITIAHEPTYHDYSIGFRCCEDAVLPPKTKTTPQPKKQGSAPKPGASSSRPQ